MKEVVLMNYYDNRDIVRLQWGMCRPFIIQGPFYALKKGNIYMFIIIMLLQITILLSFIIILKLLLGLIVGLCFILLINILFSLNYNLIVVESYLKENYIPYNHDSSELLIQKGIYFKIN